MSTRLGRLGSWLRRRWRSVAIVLAAVALGLVLLIEIATNVVLRTSIVRNALNQRPESLLVHYEGAWSLWPGTIHASAFAMRGQDSSVQWELQSDRVTFDVSLHELLHKHFQVARLRGRGLEFRLRLRREKDEVSADTLGRLPPIDGLPNPWKGYVSPVLQEADYNLWEISLENVEGTDVRELWVDRVHVTHASRVRGDFRMRPIRSIEVGDDHLILEDGRILVGQTPVLDHVRGELGVHIAKFDPRNVAGLAILSRITTRIDLDGAFPGIGAFGEVGGVARLHGGGGPAHVHLSATSGILEPGGSVDVGVEKAKAETQKGEASGDFHVALRTLRETNLGPVVGRASIEGSAAWAPLGWANAPLTAKRIAVLARTDDVDLTHPPRGAVSLDVPDASTPDVRGLFPPGVLGGAFDLGSDRADLSVHADFDPAAGVLQAKAAASLPGARVRLKDARFRGDFFAEADLAPSTLTGTPALHLEKARFHAKNVVAAASHQDPPWWAEIDSDRVTIRLGENPDVEGRVRAQMKDGRFVLALVQGEVPDWVRGLVHLDGLHGEATVRGGKRGFDVMNGHAEGGDFKVDAELRGKAGKEAGAALVRWHALSFGVGLEPDGTSLHPLGATDWFEEKAGRAAM